MWSSIKCVLLAAMMLVPGSLLTAQEEEEGVTIKYSDADKAAVEKIRDAGAAILEVAQNDNRLNVAFHLGSGEIGDEQVATVKDLGFIVSLNLRGTKVTDAGVADLQKALPNCKIYGEERSSRLPPPHSDGSGCTASPVQDLSWCCTVKVTYPSRIVD